MSDLRPWSEEDATAEEISLLDMARRRRASPAQRTAVLSALSVGAATKVASAGAAGLATKLGGLLVLAGVGVGVALWQIDGQKPALAPAPAVVSGSPAPPVSAAPLPVVEEPAPAVEAPTENPAKAIAKPKPSASAASSLSGELQLLKQAHDALAHGNPNGALAALDDYHARFPQGALGAEETVIRVQALLAKGDKARAAAVAHHFSAAHPDSLYAQRVEQLVAGAR